MSIAASSGQESTISLSREKERDSFSFKQSLPDMGPINDWLKETETRLASLDVADFSHETLAEPATYLLRKPGKLLRPALVFAGAYLLGEKMSEFVDLAMAHELLHIASLVHDDIIDDDIKRRSLQTVHARYGKETAILAGDALIAKAVELGSEYGAAVMKNMAKASVDMCAGELIDYEFQRTGSMPDLRIYLKIAKLKTASSIGSAASSVARFRGNDIANGMERLGRNLGVAFQIRDDVIEKIDIADGENNGSPNGRTRPKLNIVDVFQDKFDQNGKDALTRAVEMNNYFADRALSFAPDEKIRAELEKYVDFVRIGSR